PPLANTTGKKWEKQPSDKPSSVDNQINAESKTTAQQVHNNATSSSTLSLINPLTYLTSKSNTKTTAT
ncbi:7139_t:CDS:2, partial [Racocetra fulgida]